MSYERFDYSLPSDESFYKTLVGWLEVRGEREVLELLKGGRCTMNPTSSYSGIRWNAYGVKIYFYLPLDNLKKVNDNITSKVIEMSNQVLPKENGFDVVNAEFSPLITGPSTHTTLSENLESVAKTLSPELANQIFPEDIKQKGKEMTEAYLYLYYVENALRLFIQHVGESQFGNNWFIQLKINQEIPKKVSARKQEESKNKWMRVRGDSDVFYLDFKDLVSIIQNNWNLFSKYFPDQSWIESKIKELAECRNLIAHNSFIGDHEKDVIRVNFMSILKQLDGTIK